MAGKAIKCPLCRREASAHDHESLRLVEYIKCNRCGRFNMSAPFRTAIENGAQIREVHLVSGFIREQYELKRPNQLLKDLDSCEEILRLAPRTVAERVRKLLGAIGRGTAYFGASATIDTERDCSLAYAVNGVELLQCLNYLRDRKLATLHQASSTEFAVRLTADGFAELECQKKNNVESEKAFVAMWFDPEMRAVYESAIAPGIGDAGFKAVRTDFEEFNDDVVARILADIRESRFVVADFTGQRSGVYFETGFAMGLGLPVIWLCRQDHIKDAHFDTNHFNHIAWDNPEGLRERLSTRIKATIGIGPLRPET